jgi:hypothetical protein
MSLDNVAPAVALGLHRETWGLREFIERALDANERAKRDEPAVDPAVT